MRARTQRSLLNATAKGVGKPKEWVCLRSFGDPKQLSLTDAMTYCEAKALARHAIDSGGYAHVMRLQALNARRSA